MTEPRIIYLYGDDEYAMARRVGEFASMFQQKSTGEMNTTRLDARSMSDNDLNNAVNAMPFLAERRLVLLANPSARFSVHKAKADDGDAARVRAEVEAEARSRFLEVLEKAPSTTLVVMWDQVDPAASRGNGNREKGIGPQWLLTWMKKNAQLVESLRLPDKGAMVGWIMAEAKRQGGDFAGPAANRLWELVGNDTRQASQEITKLLTYVNWKRAVTAADVQALTPRTAEAVIWDFVDALSQGEGQKAQRLLHQFLADDGEFYVWAMIIRQFRMLLLAREVLDGGGGQKEAEAALQSKGYAVEKALKLARSWSMKRLEALYHRLLDIDEASKTGRMPLDVALDLLVAELAA
jgi:DNA polymerase III subunit delta